MVPRVAEEQGIDNLTKEEKGKIRADGFLRDDVSALFWNYAHMLDNDARPACHDHLVQPPGTNRFVRTHLQLRLAVL